MRYALAVQTVLGFLTATLFLTTAKAETYRLTVNQEGDNTYNATLEGMIVKTDRCDAHVHSEEVILETHGDGGTLKFPHSGSECDVKGVFQKTKIDAGDFRVVVTRWDENWYWLHHSGLFVRTKQCENRAHRDGSKLTLKEQGTGKISFKKDRGDCTVEALYEQHAVN